MRSTGPAGGLGLSSGEWRQCLLGCRALVAGIQARGGCVLPSNQPQFCVLTPSPSSKRKGSGGGGSPFLVTCAEGGVGAWTAQSFMVWVHFRVRESPPSPRVSLTRSV